MYNFFHFRNNLTIIDAIVVQGQGGRGEMKLSNKKPGSAQFLRCFFDFNNHDLQSQFLRCFCLNHDLQSQFLRCFCL
jgi:hypothetical protein